MNKIYRVYRNYMMHDADDWQQWREEETKAYFKDKKNAEAYVAKELNGEENKVFICEGFNYADDSYNEYLDYAIEEIALAD